MIAMHMNFFRHAILLLSIAMALVSCKDDPNLVIKRQQQEAQLLELDQELQSLEQQLKKKPKDVSVEIAVTKDELTVLQKEAARLESEIVLLREKKLLLEKEFADYRKKYPIN
ncbi:MAG: hypothetical protein V4727_10000 [Verrucomicrobiota bacterium]